jgi:hypothetical protein
MAQHLSNHQQIIYCKLLEVPGGTLTQFWCCASALVLDIRRIVCLSGMCGAWEGPCWLLEFVWLPHCLFKQPLSDRDVIVV